MDAHNVIHDIDGILKIILKKNQQTHNSQTMNF